MFEQVHQTIGTDVINQGPIGNGPLVLIHFLLFVELAVSAWCMGTRCALVDQSEIADEIFSFPTLDADPFDPTLFRLLDGFSAVIANPGLVHAVDILSVKISWIGRLTTLTFRVPGQRAAGFFDGLRGNP
jgi:hypothetical protein